MKKLLFSVLLLCGLTVHAQPAGGFGGIQQKVELATSQEWKDVNYAGDNQPFHTCDIFLPKKTADTYPVVIHIYGSAWMNNNGKGCCQQSRQRIVEDGGTGAYKTVMKEEPSLDKEHTVFVPQDLSAFGPHRPLPVLVWGNGACANSPWEHMNFLNELASHGFLVIATGEIPMVDEWYKGPMSRADQQIQSLDWVFAQNQDPQSPYYQKIDTRHICLAGMSCGGLQTLHNCADPRITAVMICNSGLFKQSNADQAVGGMPMPPKSKLNDLHCPVLYILGGTTDIAYENGMDDFRLIQHVPACVVNYPVGHGGTYREPHGGEFTVPALAWLQWQLKGDKESAKLFVGKKPELLLRDKWTLECNKKFSELKE